MPRGRMRVRSMPATGVLARHVRAFTLVEAVEESARILVPDGAVIVGLRYGGAATLGARPLPDATITGVSSRARRMRTSAGGGVVLATFREGHAGAFFRPALHELYGETRALADLLPRSAVARAEDRVRAAKADAGRVHALEDLLVAHLNPDAEDALVLAAATRMRDAHGLLRIEELARSLGIGQDALEKRFRRHVGAAPKRLASILRLHRAVTSFRPGTSLAALALDAGYFDQAHFNRDVRAATGLSPTRLLARGVRC